MADTPLLMSIDQGTTSSRALVFDRQGTLVASAQQEFQQIYPQPGWVEHGAEAIWATTISTARAALAEAERRGGRVAAIGVTNQRETTVIWNRRTLRPIHNAIVWQDRRTAPTTERLRDAGAEQLVQDKTGLLLDPYFSASKAAFILDATDGARDAAARGELAFGTIDSFLLARLTGGAHLTDATNASRTSLYDIRAGRFDDELLSLFDVPKSVLPEVRDCVSEFGETAPEIFGRAIPVRAMIGDQQSAAVGNGCIEPGDIKSTYGTGCFVLAPMREFALSKNRMLTTIARRIDGKTHYALEGSIFIAGAAVQWLRDAMGLVSSASETEAIAASLADNGGVYLVPAFTGLGAPHWNAEARGLIAGLTRGTGRAHIVRAALESVAYQTTDLLEAMAADGAPCRTLKVDGGMVANNWLMQFLADIEGAPIDRPALLETTAFGAAFLAGVGAGLYSSVSDVSSLRRAERVFKPVIDAAARVRLRDGWKLALDRAIA
jgi:glycerol kinase